MKSTTLTCDRCKATETDVSPSKLDLKIVGIGVPGVPTNSQIYYTSIPMAELKHTQEWCISCRKAYGLAWRTAEDETKQPAPTLEQQIIELLREFIQVNCPSNPGNQ